MHFKQAPWVVLMYIRGEEPPMESNSFILQMRKLRPGAEQVSRPGRAEPGLDSDA